jgi:hypothetical protein
MAAEAPPPVARYYAVHAVDEKAVREAAASGPTIARLAT